MKALDYLLNFRTNKAVLGSTNRYVKILRDNVSGIGSSFNKVHGELTKFANSQKWKNINELTRSVVGGVAGVARSVKNTFTSSFNFVNEFAKEGDSLAKSARLVGMSVKDFQAFSFAADRSGISLETFNSSMQRFSVNLGKARSGSKTAGQMFQALLPGKLSDYKSEREVILAMSDSYKKLSESQRNFVSSSVFGKSGLKFGELLSGGSENLSGLLTRFKELGGGFDEATAKRAESFIDMMTDMRVAMKSLKVVVGTELVPVFTELFGALTNYVTKNRGELQKTLREFSKVVVGGVQYIVPKIPSIVSGLTNILSVVGSIVDYIGPIKTIVGVGLVASLGSIFSVVTGLAGLIGGPTLAAVAGVAVVIGECVSIVKQFYDNWEMLSAAVSDLLTGIKDGFFEAFEFISNGFEDAFGRGFTNGMRGVVKSIPLFGKMFFPDVKFDEPTGGIISDGDIAEMMKAQNRTVTNRFSVDFKNMPRGVKVTAPKSGDFDYSYGYVLDGGY